MRNDLVFFAGIAWLAVLLAVTIAAIGRARTTAERLVAAESRRTYALDAALILALLSFVSTVAASRYLGDRRPFTEPEEEEPR